MHVFNASRKGRLSFIKYSTSFEKPFICNEKCCGCFRFKTTRHSILHDLRCLRHAIDGTNKGLTFNSTQLNRFHIPVHFVEVEHISTPLGLGTFLDLQVTLFGENGLRID